MTTSTTKNDGGPAFPRASTFGRRPGKHGGEAQLVESSGHSGMSLRDWFAGQALPQAIAHEIELRRSSVAPVAFRYEAIAHAAYVVADAMLAERER